VTLHSLHAWLAGAPTAPACSPWDRAGMLALSRAIEAEIAAASGAVLFTFFQHERALRAALPRYQALASQVRHLYVIADAVPPALATLPNVTAVTTGAADPMNDEWALVLLTAEGGAVLSGVAEQGDADGDAGFRGFWSCDPRVLQTARGVLPELLAERGVAGALAPAPYHAPGAAGWRVGERLAQRAIDQLQHAVATQRRARAAGGQTLAPASARGADPAWAEETFAATALDQVQESVIACDLSGRVRYWNHAAAETFGWSAAEICGQPLTRIFPVAERTGAPTPLAQLHTRGAIAGVWEGRHRNGEPRRLQIRTTPLHGADGAPLGLLGIGCELVVERRRRPRTLRATA